MNYSTERDALVFSAVMLERRLEVSELRALCVVYRAMLEEAGIEPPQDEHGAEALRRYRAVFEAAGYTGDPQQHSELIANWSSIFPKSHETILT